MLESRASSGGSLSGDVWGATSPQLAGASHAAALASTEPASAIPVTVDVPTEGLPAATAWPAVVLDVRRGSGLAT